jgi:hypothetical protein
MCVCVCVYWSDNSARRHCHCACCYTPVLLSSSLRYLQAADVFALPLRASTVDSAVKTSIHTHTHILAIATRANSPTRFAATNLITLITLIRG